jgi:hypothetical protein
VRRVEVVVESGVDRGARFTYAFGVPCAGVLVVALDEPVEPA